MTRLLGRPARLLGTGFFVFACSSTTTAPSPTGGSTTTCGTTSVTFTLDLPSKAPSCLGDDSTCYSWITVRAVTADGGESDVTIDAPCGVLCGACELADCICEASPPTTATQTRSWNGRTYTASTEGSSCFEPYRCAEPACAAAGRYIAHMCASPLGPLDASTNFICMADTHPSPASCVDVPFDWPPAKPGTVVKGSLAPDAG